MENKFILGPLQTKWIEALESGKYKKGVGKLRSDKDEYCCLGVLCEVLKIPVMKDRSLYRYGTHCEASAFLPPEAMIMVGMKSNSGDMGLDGNLVNLNDAHDSFEPVIKAIKENAEILFIESL